ncbi:MAG: molecular chaperone HscC [Coriobacteriales bacterium]|nr:molecular chaperone HscC [Coriobacteriales bacterium]
MIVGIDLGTTNSLVAYFDGEHARIIPNRLGENLTPSVVSVDEDGTLLVGRTALTRALRHPLSSASVFKRSMGTDRVYTLGDKSFRSEELSSFVLRSLKEDAEHFLGEPVEEAIISVPAYFNDSQRKATKRAGELAGLKVERIINEPTAAAITHGLLDEKEKSRYLVFDLGGGTFDVSILERSGSIIEVRSIAGDNFLGGEDFTDVVEKLFCKGCNIELSSLSVEDRAALREAAEKCKCSLPPAGTVTMSCDIAGEKKETSFSISTYEQACEPLFDRLRRPVERSLRDAGIRARDIDEVVLVGGATKATVVRKLAARLFGRIPRADVNPDEAVALGAALQCGIKERAEAIKEVILTDVCPFTLGTEVVNQHGRFDEGGRYLPIIERNTVIPVSHTETVFTVSDYQEQVRVEVLQGESRIARNNLLLGEVRVPVPPKPKGEEAVDITFTYDINSLLEVKVYVHSTGYTKTIIIKGEGNQMTDEEAKARMEELSYLKISPRDQEENKLVMYRAQLLYEESTGDDRARIDRAIADFEAALERGREADIKQAREDLQELMDTLRTF